MRELCGFVYGECALYKVSCTGCTAEKGSPYWIWYIDAGVSPVYSCRLKERGGKSCAECTQLPWELWYKFKDTAQTETAHEAGVRRQVKVLRGGT